MKATKMASMFGTALVAALLFGAAVPAVAAAEDFEKVAIEKAAIVGQVQLDKALVGDLVKKAEPEPPVDDSAIVEEDSGVNSDSDQAAQEPAPETGDEDQHDQQPPASELDTPPATHDSTPSVGTTPTPSHETTPPPSNHSTPTPPPSRRLPHTGGNELGFLLLGAAAIVVGGVVLLVKPKDDAC